MDSDFYKDSSTYRDGRILIYKRPNSNNYQYRLRVEGVKGYVIKSADTSNLGRAISVAEEAYDKIRYRKLNRLPLKTKTFKEISEEWLKKADKSEYRKDFYISRFKLYLNPYFGDYNVEDITAAIIDDYWVWRKNYYKINPDKKYGNATESPSEQSLKMEKTAIKEVLSYAFHYGYIRAIPEISYKSRKKTECRPTFDKGEYNKLVSYLYDLSKQDGRVNIVYQYKILYNLVVFLANSGIRPAEYYKIKWKDITIHNEGGIKILYISVPNSTKTGRRIVVSLPEAYSVYENIKMFSKYTNPDDLFFTNFDGSECKNISKTYNDALTNINLRFDRDGKPRPMYSLRHYYATQRLLDGVSVYDLSKNMGTSVKEIENHYGHVLPTQKSKELIQGATKSKHQRKTELTAKWWCNDITAEEASIEYQKIDDN